MKFSSFLPAIGWLIVCTVLLCLPGSTVPRHPFFAAVHADKWIHIGLFCGLCLLSFLPLLKYRLNHPLSSVWFWLIIFSGIVYGTVMEFVQKYWVINRSFDGWDIVADGAGCVLAYFLCRTVFVQRWLKKNWSR